jgi:putative ABC transport system permease protein
VADVKNGGVDRPTGTELYIPREQMDGRGSLSSYLLVRSSVPSARLVSTIRSVIRDMDDAAAISQVRPMDDVLTAARSRPRFLTILLTLFASVAAVLAATGIYGVISFSVAQRTSEIGVRMALGARRVDVVWLVLKQGLALALAGAVFGAAAALAITRSMQGLLFGVSAFDMATFLTTAIGLIAIAAAACIAPASRAAAVDPVVALKYE